MTNLLTVALLGFCATRIEGIRTCSEIEVIQPSDHLISLCAPWARHVGGKGWSYSNSQSKAELEDRQKDECARIIRREPMLTYSCGARRFCSSGQESLPLPNQVRAYSSAGGIDACWTVAAEDYSTLVRAASRENCGIAVTADLIKQ